VSFSAIGIEKEEGMVMVEEESDAILDMCVEDLALIPCEKAQKARAPEGEVVASTTNVQTDSRNLSYGQPPSAIPGAASTDNNRLTNLV
jgi:hypothetical protein